MRGGGDAFNMGNYVFIPTISKATPEELVAHGLLALNRGTGGNVYFGILSGVVKINYYNDSGILLVWGSLSTSQVVYSAYMLNGTYTMEISHTNNFVSGNVHGYYGYYDANNIPGFIIDSSFRTRYEALSAMDDGIWTPTIDYPIHYAHSVGCTITGPADAAPGQDCVVIVNPSEGYTFKGSSGVRIQDSSGANVPFIVSGNRISFTYPQPI